MLPFEHCRLAYPELVSERGEREKGREEREKGRERRERRGERGEREGEIEEREKGRDKQKHKTRSYVHVTAAFWAKLPKMIVILQLQQTNL